MKLLVSAFSAVVFVLVLAAGAPDAWAQDDPECAVICDSLAGCFGARSVSGSDSGGTGVSEPREDPSEQEPGAEDEEGGDEPGDDDGGNDDDEGGDNDDDDEREGDAEDAEGDDDELINPAIREACMASCGQVKAAEAAMVTAAAGCVAELEHCWDFDDECGDLVQLPSCVSACEKLIECGEFDPCGDSVTVSTDGAVPDDAESTDAVPPQEGGGDADGGGEAPQPEEREFQLECDDDGNFDEDEAVMDCAGECAQAAFIAFDEVNGVADCVIAEQCGEVEEICADEVEVLADADGMEDMGGGGGATMGVGGRHADDSANAEGGGAGGDGDEAAGQAGGGGNGPTGGPANGGGGGRSSDGGLCASAPGRSVGGLPQLIGMVLRR